MGDHVAPTWDQLLEVAKTLEGEELFTGAMRIPFAVQVVADSIVFIPSTTKKPRPEHRVTGERFLEAFAISGVSKTSEYTSITVNSSYLLALINVGQKLGFR
jgi:hypothetical protein